MLHEAVPRRDKENKLIELFITVDDFCIALENWKSQQAKFSASVTNQPVMSDSEMLTILVYYQYSGYKCFHRVAGRYYYEDLVATTLHSYFPKQVSYPRFVALIPRLLPGLYLLLKWCTLLSRRTNCYFIDSKKLSAIIVGFITIKYLMAMQLEVNPLQAGSSASKYI